MKKAKLIFIFLMLLAPSSFLVADCIGNTTHSCTVTTGIHQTGPVSFPGITGPTETVWCCSPVGDGSDFSCSDGQNWELSSTLGCTTAPL